MMEFKEVAKLTKEEAERVNYCLSSSREDVVKKYGYEWGDTIYRERHIYPDGTRMETNFEAFDDEYIEIMITDVTGHTSCSDSFHNVDILRKEGFSIKGRKGTVYTVNFVLDDSPEAAETPDSVLYGRPNIGVFLEKAAKMAKEFVDSAYDDGYKAAKRLYNNEDGCHFCRADDDGKVRSICFDLSEGYPNESITIEFAYGILAVAHKRGEELLYQVETKINRCPICGSTLRDIPVDYEAKTVEGE